MSFLTGQKPDHARLRVMRLSLIGAAFRARWYLGLRAAMSVGIPLLAGVIAGRSGWGAVASFGGLAGFYGRDAPRPYRIRIVAGVGIALAAVVPLGSLCASRAWLAVAFAAGVAATSSFLFLAWQIPPPREYLVILAALAATGIPADATGALRECALVAGGATVAVVVTVTPTLGRRHARPQRRALAETWAAVAGVLDEAGTSRAEKARGEALTRVSRAREVLTQARTAPDDPRWRSLAAVEMILASALSVSIEASAPLDPCWAASVRRLAESPPDEVAAAGRTASGRPDLPGLRWAMGQASGTLSAAETECDTGVMGSRSLLGAIRAALSPHTVVLPAAVRIGVIVAAGTALGRAVGLDHSYWIGLTAAAILQANNVTFLVRRALNRIAGTMAGVGLAWAVFLLHPPVAAVATAAICAQFAAEVLMPASYGLAVAFVTVVALALYDLAASGAGIAVTSGARLLDTLIGAVLAVILRLALWPRANATRMPYLQAKTLQAVAATFRSRWLSDGHGLRPAQRCLQTELLNLRAVYRDTVADQVTAATGGAGYVTPVVDELAVLALGIPFERPDPARPAAEALIRRLDQLTDALAARKAPQEGGEPVSLPGYPRTEAAVNLLTALQLRILGRP